MPGVQLGCLHRNMLKTKLDEETVELTTEVQKTKFQVCLGSSLNICFVVSSEAVRVCSSCVRVACGVSMIVELLAYVAVSMIAWLSSFIIKHRGREMCGGEWASDSLCPTEPSPNGITYPEFYKVVSFVVMLPCFQGVCL